ncbi:MAG: PAS domain S-box protein, partial [Nitrososphaerales archaeon]
MPTNNGRSALRISLLLALVLIITDLLIGFVLLNLALPTLTTMRLLILMDLPLAMTYVAYLYIVLRRELGARGVMDQRLQESETRLRLIMDNLPAAISYLDRDQRYTFANAGYERLMGMSPSTIVGQRLHDVMQPETYQANLPYLEAALAGKTQAFENELPKAGGGTFRAMVQYVPDYRGDEVVGVHVLLTDISPLREAQEALAREHAEVEAAARAHANELQTLLDAVPNAVFIARDPACEFMSGSDLAYQLLRRPKGSNLSKSAADGDPPTGFRVVVDGRELQPHDLPLQRAARTGVGERNYQFDLAFEDGEVVSLIGNAVPLLDELGRPCGAIGAFADITALKRVESALRASEATVRQQLAEIEAVYNSAPVGLAVVDTQLRYRRVNQRLAEINGIAAHEHLGKTMREVLPQFADISEQIVAWILKTREPALNRVFTGTTLADPDREHTWVEHWVPFFGPEGEIDGINVVVEDVTEQRRVQAELLESQELMRRALDVGRGFAFQYRMRSDEVIRSPESAKILGLPDGPKATSDTGPAYFQRVHPQDRSRYVARMLELTPQNDSYRTTYRIVRPDGRTIAVEESARGLFDADGTLIQVFGITQDVTERVQAEQERERLLEQVQAQQARLAGLARDLQAERDIMAAIMENTRTQLAYLDPQFRFVKVNSAYAAGSGHTVHSLLGKDHFSLFPNKENEAIFEHVRDTGQPVENRAKPFVFPDQSERGTTYWDWTLAPVKNPDGIVHGLVLALSDVTEQKRAEEVLRTARDELQQRVSEATAELRAVVVSLEAEIADRERAEALLRESEARLRILVEQVPAILWTTNGDLVYTSSEGAGLASIHVQPGQLVGTRVPGILGDGSDSEGAIEAHRRALHGEGVTFRAQWGEAHFEGYIEPLREADGKIVGCIGVALDITERVRSEEVQREREQQYRNVFESTSDGMVIINADGQIIDANPAASKMSGYDDGELLRLNPLTFIRSDQREPLERFFQSVRSGRRLERQAIGVRRDGSEFDLEVRASQFQHAGELHVLAVLRDITERVRSFQLLEQRVRERTRELSALLAFSRQATATLEVRPLMELVVEEVSRLVESTGVSLLMLEGETLKMAAHRGPLPASTAEQVRLTVNDPGLRNLLLTNPTPIVLSDVQMEGQQAEAVRRAGGPLMDGDDSLHSIMWIPLVVKQKLIGGIGIGHKERGQYTEREAGLVQAIASQAAVALENARLYEQAHELAVMHERQRLARELHDSVTQSLYSLSLMAEAARRLVAAGNQERGIGYLVRIGESAQQVLKEMRLLVYELRPLMLERDG